MNDGNTSNDLPPGVDSSSSSDAEPQAPEYNLTSDIPSPKQQAEALAKAEEGKKRYAHHGKRRRRFTEELFRCPHIDKISRSDLVCNALLWKNRPDELRKHLAEHISLDEIGKMTDDEVTNWYVQAKRIFLAGIPEDLEEGDQEDEPEE